MSAFYVPHLLKFRRFLVTGATGGAGSRTAVEISRCGGICTLLVRHMQNGEKILRELHGTGHGLAFLGDDFPGPFDGIFHAAGEANIKPLSQNEAGAPDVARDLGITLLAQAAKRKDALVKDGGSIVFMSSVAAIRGQTGMSFYCASKAAVEGLVRAAAVELAPRRIRVNCIRAGGFASPMHSRLTQHMPVAAIDEYANRHLLGFGRSEDIANAAMFLLSDASRWCTGGMFPIDGGYTAR